jgi:hypothetical protein
MHTGAVTFIQRTDSALRLNPHWLPADRVARRGRLLLPSSRWATLWRRCRVPFCILALQTNAEVLHHETRVFALPVHCFELDLAKVALHRPVLGASAPRTAGCGATSRFHGVSIREVRAPFLHFGLLLAGPGRYSLLLGYLTQDPGSSRVVSFSSVGVLAADKLRPGSLTLPFACEGQDVGNRRQLAVR